MRELLIQKLTENILEVFVKPPIDDTEMDTITVTYRIFETTNPYVRKGPYGYEVAFRYHFVASDVGLYPWADEEHKSQMVQRCTEAFADSILHTIQYYEWLTT